MYRESSNDAADIQQIMSCHKNRMTTDLVRKRNVFDNDRVNTAFFIKIMIILTAIQNHFKGQYDKKNLTITMKSFYTARI